LYSKLRLITMIGSPLGGLWQWYPSDDYKNQIMNNRNYKIHGLVRSMEIVLDAITSLLYLQVMLVFSKFLTYTQFLFSVLIQ
jgi:hypothetical protein